MCFDDKSDEAERDAALAGFLQYFHVSVTRNYWNDRIIAVICGSYQRFRNR